MYDIVKTAMKNDHEAHVKTLASHLDVKNVMLNWDKDIQEDHNIEFVKEKKSSNLCVGDNKKQRAQRKRRTLQTPPKRLKRWWCTTGTMRSAWFGPRSASGGLCW